MVRSNRSFHNQGYEDEDHVRSKMKLLRIWHGNDEIVVCIKDYVVGSKGERCRGTFRVAHTVITIELLASNPDLERTMYHELTHYIIWKYELDWLIDNVEDVCNIVANKLYAGDPAEVR